MPDYPPRTLSAIASLAIKFTPQRYGSSTSSFCAETSQSQCLTFVALCETACSRILVLVRVVGQVTVSDHHGIFLLAAPVSLAALICGRCSFGPTDLRWAFWEALDFEANAASSSRVFHRPRGRTSPVPFWEFFAQRLNQLVDVRFFGQLLGACFVSRFGSDLQTLAHPSQ